MKTRLATVAASAALICTLTPTPAPAALTPTTYEKRSAYSANYERYLRDIRMMSWRSDLLEVARRHARKMAASRTIFHNPTLGSEVEGWTAVGENVARGTSISAIHKALMASSGHRSNILYRPYNQIGVGVAKGTDGRYYVSQVFAKRSG